MEEKKLLENEALANADGGANGLDRRRDEFGFASTMYAVSGDASLTSSAVAKVRPSRRPDYPDEIIAPDESCEDLAEGHRLPVK